MSYKQIKWLIILVPTLTIEIWELVRHDYLHPYISMHVGNWLSALVVLTVTLLVTARLFRRMEALQEELNREKAYKAALVERERIARELHDGIAQSMFLLSVKIHRLEEDNSAWNSERIKGLKETVRRVHDDVRQAITNLRLPAPADSPPWTQSVKAIIRDFENETGLSVSLEWDLDGELEQLLTPKDKVEIFACLREALMNIRKHANALHTSIRFRKEQSGWSLTAEDDGRGFEGDPFNEPSRYGLRMMRERVQEMGWQFRLDRSHGGTRIEIRGGAS
ncbi:sensor histidine kinase [Effusibacillus consociatus]|uniref:histidine kinase n=1 Tax=Effusibacillus consociatus TaxID=1117041 RepID=A0ABV9Q5W6_9BACL